MKRKYKKPAKGALAVTLVATYVTNSTGNLFASNESQVSEYELIKNGEAREEDTEVEIQSVEVTDELLENKEDIQNIEKAAGDIEINEVNFPNEVFRQYISTNFDGNNDNVLSTTELNAVTSINLNNLSNKGEITSIVGIEHFPNLSQLHCLAVPITTLDISKNTALVYLECGYTQITSLDTSKNVRLQTLRCGGTKITSLDLSKNTALQKLWCHYSAFLRGLDISKNTALDHLDALGTNLAWLKIGSNSKLATAAFTNNSTILLENIDETFNITDMFPGIDLTKITNISGASINSTTGIVSGYTVGNPISYTYDCGTSKAGRQRLNVRLNFTKRSTVTIDNDISKVYDGTIVSEPIVTKIGSTGNVSFEWYTSDGTKLGGAPMTAGSYKVKAILAGDTNYVGAEVEKEFTISQASSTVTINDNLNKVYDGVAVKDPTNVVATGSTGNISFEWYTLDGTKLSSAPMTAGSYKVKAILAGDTNYVGAEVEKEFTISQASSTVTINDDLNKVYDGVAVKDPTNVVATGSTGNISFEWYTSDGTKLGSAPMTAGSYKVKAILAGDTNHVGAEVEKEFEISKASTSITIIGELNKKFDGIAMVEPSVNVTGSSGVVSFEWYKKEVSTTKVVTWVKLVVSPREVGEYKIVITVAENENYSRSVLEKEFSILENRVVVPTPGFGGIVVNPDGGTIKVNLNDKIESNGLTIINPDGSITFPNGGTITRPDGSIEIIPSGGVLLPSEVEQKPVEDTNTSDNQITGIQTGDVTKVGLWTTLVGLSTGFMIFFRKKKDKEEV